MSTRTTLALFVLVAGCNKPTIIQETPSSPAAQQGQQGAAPSEEQRLEAVRESVRDYAEALTAKDGEAAAALVVAATFGFYEDLRIAALRSTREQLESWDLMSVLMVLQIRSRVSRAELEALDGRGLFLRAVADGLVGDGVDEVGLDEIWIDEAGAHAEVRVDGQPVVWLQREQGAAGRPRWQIDIPGMVREIGPAFEAMARERVVADGKLRTAMTFLELSSPTFIDVAILDGPLDCARCVAAKLHAGVMSAGSRHPCERLRTAKACSVLALTFSLRVVLGVVFDRHFVRGSALDLPLLVAKHRRDNRRDRRCR